MTARERAELAARVAAARAENAEAERLLRQAMWPKRSKPTGRCVYCGCRSWGRTCAGHRDLAQIERSAS